MKIRNIMWIAGQENLQRRSIHAAKERQGICVMIRQKNLVLQGCQKGYLYAVYALIYKATVQDDAWNKNDVEPEEMWFGVFFYQNKNILHRCRSPPLKFGNLLISNFGGRK